MSRESVKAVFIFRLDLGKMNVCEAFRIHDFSKNPGVLQLAKRAIVQALARGSARSGRLVEAGPSTVRRYCFGPQWSLFMHRPSCSSEVCESRGLTLTYHDKSMDFVADVTKIPVDKHLQIVTLWLRFRHTCEVVRRGFVVRRLA